MSEDLAQLIKVAASKYQQGTTHTTIVKGEGVTKTLEKCINWWITGVDANSFDIQILNRYVNVSLDEPNRQAREDHKMEVHLHQLQDAATGRPANNVTREIRNARA